MGGSREPTPRIGEAVVEGGLLGGTRFAVFLGFFVFFLCVCVCFVSEYAFFALSVQEGSQELLQIYPRDQVDPQGQLFRVLAVLAVLASRPPRSHCMVARCLRRLLQKRPKSVIDPSQIPARNHQTLVCEYPRIDCLREDYASLLMMVLLDISKGWERRSQAAHAPASHSSTAATVWRWQYAIGFDNSEKCRVYWPVRTNNELCLLRVMP